MDDADIVVIGAGPNGLFAACRLARAGLKVLVLEANDRPGGALWSLPTTGPGTVHDVGAGFIAFADSVAFRTLELESRGLEWLRGELETTHPAVDGTVAGVSGDPALCDLGDAQDTAAFLELQRWHARAEPGILPFLGPLGRVAPVFDLGIGNGLKLASMFLRSPGGLARRLFRGAPAQRVMPGMGMHVDLGPDDPMGSAVGYMLTMRSTTSGFLVPKGGARRVSELLVDDLLAHGGQIQLGSRVQKVSVLGGRAYGVVLEGGISVSARQGVVADTSAPALYLTLLDERFVPGRIRRSMQRFPMGWGTFKVDLRLSGPVPWRDPLSGRSAVVHAGDSVEDLGRFTRQVRGGDLPDDPYLVIGQHSLLDPTRAPEGEHVLYVYTRVPARLDGRYPGGWEAWRERMADRVVERIEALAPGFREQVLGRAIHDPGDLERMSANLIDGDLGGGSNQWHRQLVFRPVFPYFRHRTPVDRLYMASSYTHPGTGIHGMCGWNAAEMALQDMA